MTHAKLLHIKQYYLGKIFHAYMAINDLINSNQKPQIMVWEKKPFLRGFVCFYTKNFKWTLIKSHMTDTYGVCKDQ